MNNWIIEALAWWAVAIVVVTTIWIYCAKVSRAEPDNRDYSAKEGRV